MRKKERHLQQRQCLGLCRMPADACLVGARRRRPLGPSVRYARRERLALRHCGRLSQHCCAATVAATLNCGAVVRCIVVARAESCVRCAHRRRLAPKGHSERRVRIAITKRSCANRSLASMRLPHHPLAEPPLLRKHGVGGMRTALRTSPSRSGRMGSLGARSARCGVGSAPRRRARHRSTHGQGTAPMTAGPMRSSAGSIS